MTGQYTVDSPVTSNMPRRLTNASKGFSVAETNVSEGALDQGQHFDEEILMSKNTATADKPFSPTKSLLSKIAAQTNASTHEYQETVDFLENRLQRSDGKWRCYFKTLVVIEYLLHLGNERCVRWATENLDSIRALELFNHADGKAKFRGMKDHTPKILCFPTSVVDI